MDCHGNLNTHWVGDDGRRLRLPGSGGAADIATLAGRCVIIMNHERRRFVPRVQYITSPGYGDGAGWREQRGLSGRRARAGPSASLGIFSFDPATREMQIESHHPGVTVQEIRDRNGLAA